MLNISTVLRGMYCFTHFKSVKEKGLRFMLKLQNVQYTFSVPISMIYYSFTEVVGQPDAEQIYDVKQCQKLNVETS